jgi:glutamate-1-semialdehyde 2,1-aminomutase
MDAIRVARAATGRDVVCKIEGSYHGHHDSVMFSILPNADLMGGRDRPGSAPVSKGMVKDAAKYIEVVPFNAPGHPSASSRSGAGRSPASSSSPR